VENMKNYKDIMEKNLENMKKYVGNMEEYVENMKEFEKIRGKI